ncbi:hypothetical protein [Ralstonia solanacearum]|uniref:hypothetical protein n=1 Tax=Ralstonia solanacearum TaxID=305 RepID=UPI001E4C25F4|nr:hypothetical protein [Ralstonia solanacearum]
MKAEKNVGGTMRRSIAAFKALVWLLLAGLLAGSGEAGAVPAFARQTGMACMACHVSFPELTPFGRFFKMAGYTLKNNDTIPLSGMLQISRTNTRTIDQEKPGEASSTMRWRRSTLLWPQ